MMMNLAMGHAADFPEERRRSGNMHLARPIEEVGLYSVIGRIEHAHAIGDDRVSVIIRSERVGGPTPNALIVLLQGERLRIAFEQDGNFFVVGSAKAERHSIVRVHLGGDQWR